MRGENSSDGAGVTGFTGSGYGVYGSASGNGYGVYGTVSGANPGTEGVNTGSGHGVYGSSATGPGGYFTSAGGDGLDANTTSGYGVYAIGGNGYGLYGFSQQRRGRRPPKPTAAPPFPHQLRRRARRDRLSAEGNGPGVYAYSNGTSVSNPALLRLQCQQQRHRHLLAQQQHRCQPGHHQWRRRRPDQSAFNGGNNLYFRVTANGTTITRVLQITGGADVAEPYTVGAAEDVTPLPGMVVSIDPDHVGQMTLAHAAYDRDGRGHPQRRRAASSRA